MVNGESCLNLESLLLNWESGLIFILSEPGTGKTSLAAAITEDIYNIAGQERLEKCNEVLTELNKTRDVPFELATEPPIYAAKGFDLHFKIDYEKYFTPLIINPYYLGLTNNKLDTQYLLPYGVVVIPELQKYTNSRKGQSLPEAFSRTFEIYRHWHLLFIADGHRGSFIDLRVRALARLVIEPQEQIHEYDEMGRIIKTTWHLRLFYNLRDYDDYIEHNTPTYTEAIYTHDYDIFEDYDSYSCSEEFIPPANKTFSMLKPLSRAEISKLPPEIAKFYVNGEPAGFRGGAAATKYDNKEKKEKCATKSKS